MANFFGVSWALGGGGGRDAPMPPIGTSLIARSGVKGRPFRITFDTDQKVIRSSVNGALA